ncbi:MAG: HAMP domain-containing histidine kinase, partial [Myxococcales bacterium]|nr:HAMP domain-containing histidine kinase [Myxococcales bacterium]
EEVDDHVVRLDPERLRKEVRRETTGEIEGAREREEASRELEAVTIDSSNEDLNVKLLQPPTRWVLDTHGRGALEAICRNARVDIDKLDGNYWLSTEQFDAFLRGVQGLTSSEEEFFAALKYKFGYGPLGFILRTVSVKRLYQMAARTIKLVAKNADWETSEGGRGSIVMTYTTTRPESRLVCMSRQAACRVIPTVFDLPEVQLEEKSCTAWGDEACVYHLSWNQRPQWMAGALGAGIGWLAGLALTAAGLSLAGVSPQTWLTLFGAGFGYIWELRRTIRANYAFTEDTNGRLRELATKYQIANEEIMLWNKRQNSWNQILEEQVAERTSRLRRVIDTANKMVERRDTTLMSFSHDLRNPLTVLKAGIDELQLIDGPADAELMTDLKTSVRAMERLIQSLLENAEGHTDLVKLSVVQLDVSALAHRLRRRLRAMVLNKDIRISVFTSREAPGTIEADEVVMDRIIDNLLSNAAKFTQSGSIVVELTGSPGVLTLKVSDTGRGISEERIEQVFQSGQRDTGVQDVEGYGLGLPVLVRLLDQIGGRLEVMSEPHVGTTFWAHFPTQIKVSSDKRSNSGTFEEVVGRIVTIRPSHQSG